MRFRFCRSQEEQQVQLAADVPVHDGRHDHPAGVRRAGAVGRQSADHRQTSPGAVGHRRSQETVRRPGGEPRVHHHARRRRRRPLPQELARRTRGRHQHGVQLVHARLRGPDPEHRVVQLHSAVKEKKKKNEKSLTTKLRLSIIYNYLFDERL